MRIVQVANFVGPSSVGLRTALEAMGAGYASAGHERVLIVPGAVDGDVSTATGRRITLRAPALPGSGGCRLLIDRRRVTRLLTKIAPDRIEVSDRTTLRSLGPWARARGIGSVAICHERLDALLRLPVLGRSASDGSAASTAC